MRYPMWICCCKRPSTTSAFHEVV